MYPFVRRTDAPVITARPGSPTPLLPAHSFRKRSPARGPAGMILVGGVLGIMGFSLYRLVYDVEERK